MSRLLERDAAHVWHPYTQHASEPAPLPVVAARDAVLTLEDGREVIDGISSWWSILHGHGRQELVDAAATQASTLDHVLLAGATHEPAVSLAESLAEVTPAGLSRVFYSDNGSTAVESALKMVVQRWVQQGEAQRRVFLTLEGSYHGDTFGSMAVGDPDPFFLPFQPMLFETRRARPLEHELVAALDELGDRAAGVLLEPLVQGAAGMKMHSVELLQSLRRECDARGLPLVADEVMTGFGRTGHLFACEKAGVSPDVLCLAKGLTGGMMPLAATVTTEEMFQSFLHEDRHRAFFHGHTFTGHAIGCAVALASLRLVKEEDTPGRLDRLGGLIEGRLREHPAVAGEELGLRRCGGIVAVDLPPPPGEQAGYLASLGPKLRAAALERGVLLRPLGTTLYALPPACTTDEQAGRIAEVMGELVAIATGD
ncbi:MAG: adenosylmethionine--8-amino-7-oxononanoate transaminase [Acidobacteriota bacterium]